MQRSCRLSRAPQPFLPRGPHSPFYAICPPSGQLESSLVTIQLGDLRSLLHLSRAFYYLKDDAKMGDRTCV
jgi:hypothetical protein